ncbi:MAG: mechanosensitive ion channel, partial [Alphaproteobacteria bacterium]|nr:mechanosensitive ion channel [Alphaproteobacteria bacterium]
MTLHSPQALLSALVLCLCGLALATIRRRLDPASRSHEGVRIGELAALGFTALAVLEAMTGLPIWRAVRTIRDVADFEIGTLSGSRLTPITLMTVAAVIGMSWWLSKLARQGLTSVLARRNIGDPNSIAAIARLTQYIVMGVGAAVGLDTLGLDLSALFAAGAVFAVGLGFAMQQIAENFV